MTPVMGAERDAMLRAKLAEHPAGATIIYVTLQKTAEMVASMLQQEGLSARAYHAGMKPDIRALDTGLVHAPPATALWWRPLRLAWASTRPISAMSTTIICQKALKTILRKSAGPGRDGERSICQALICLDDLAVLEKLRLWRYTNP